MLGQAAWIVSNRGKFWLDLLGLVGLGQYGNLSQELAEGARRAKPEMVRGATGAAAKVQGGSELAKAPHHKSLPYLEALMHFLCLF